MRLELDGEIGRGSQGVVYALADGRVLKRYFGAVSKRRVKAEYRCARMAYDGGVPTWRPDFVARGGRSIVGSRVEGVSLSAMGVRRPWAVPSLMAELGRLHAAVHRLEPAPPAPGWRVRTRLPLADGSIGGLSPAAMVRVNEILSAAQETTGFCHGDLAPNNVRVHDGRLSLLDWGRSGIGVQALDVGLTYCFLLCMPYGGLKVPARLRLRFRLFCADAYLDAYASATGARPLASEIWALHWLCREAELPERAASRALIEGARDRLRERVAAKLRAPAG